MLESGALHCGIWCRFVMCFAIGAHVAGSADGLSSLDLRPPAQGGWGMVRRKS